MKKELIKKLVHVSFVWICGMLVGLLWGFGLGQTSARSEAPPPPPAPIIVIEPEPAMPFKVMLLNKKKRSMNVSTRISDVPRNAFCVSRIHPREGWVMSCTRQK